MDVGGGSGGGSGGRGGAAALALLSLHQGWAADASACAACLRPRAAGGGTGAHFTWLWQREAAELFGRRWQGSVNGNVRASSAVHLWMWAAAGAAVAAAGGGQRCLLCLACVGVRLLMHQLALRACGPGRQGGGSGARFAWFALGSGC
jgi:hypothetical protein